MKLHLFPIALCGLFNIAQANDQMRNWTFVSGKTEAAEIIAYNEAEKRVTLRRVDRGEAKFDEAEFSAIDRAWILQWVEQDEEARELVVKLGGSVTEHVGTGEFTTQYAVYHPPGVEAGTELPMLILFHPGGNGRRGIYNYVEAASKVGITLVSMDYFQNTGDDPVEEAKMLARFTELLPQIEASVAHDKKRIFMGGTSGGAWRAYHYSAQVARPWAGILAGGGWLGGKKYYHLPYPRLRVAIVNGDKDLGANAVIEADSAVLQQAHSIVSVHAFEGGHQMPPPSVQEKAIRWLLSNEGEPTPEQLP